MYLFLISPCGCSVTAPESPLILQRLNVVYVTVVSRCTAVIPYMSFMYQDIYRSFDKFSAAVGKSLLALKIKEKNGESERQATFKKKKHLNEGANSFQVYFT